MVNTKGLERALAVVEEADLDGRWRQGDWIRKSEDGSFCGCFAGLYALDQGMVPVFDDDEDTWTSIVLDENGNNIAVESWARQELGLTVEQASWLFDSDNGMDDLQEHVSSFCYEPVTV